MRRFITLLILLFATVGYADTPGFPTGSWTYAGGESEREKMEATVDDIVSDMNLFIRPIARSRLKKECKPWKKLQIERTGDGVAVTTELGTLTSPLGRPVKQKTDDGLITIDREVRDGVLFEKLSSEGGSRTNEYRSLTNGIRVKSTINAPQLPRPVNFTYTYR